MDEGGGRREEGEGVSTEGQGGGLRKEGGGRRKEGGGRREERREEEGKQVQTRVTVSIEVQFLPHFVQFRLLRG